MKNRYILALVLNLSWILSVEGQTTFKNLGFEVGVPVPIPDDPLGRVYAQGAFPHWTAFIGTNQQTAVFFNKRSFSSSAISILDYRCAFPGYIAGRYTPFLQARAAFPGVLSVPADVSLIQTAFVPSDAKSLRLLGRAGANSVFDVSIGGFSLDLISCPTGSNCLGYVADISAFAGMVLPLEFKLFAPREPGIQATACLDSIEFSPMVAQNVLWLEISRASDSLLVTVHGTTAGQGYHIFTKERWADPWVIEQEITGASGQNWTQTKLLMGSRPNLFCAGGSATAGYQTLDR
jgi:hypothetical protein